MVKKKVSFGNIKIIKDIKKGISAKEIMKKYNIVQTHYNFYYYQAINNLFLRKGGATSTFDSQLRETGFGFKNEPYFTEEEMIQGIPNYTWKDLPRNEKEFYYKYNHEMRNGWTEKEIKIVEDYYHASDHELKSDTWLYIKEMIDQSGLNFPNRTINAYRYKMQKVWRSRKELEKFQVN